MSTAELRRAKAGVPVESIRRQPNEERDCAFVAIQNLYVWAGLEPPTLERMREAARLCYTTQAMQGGLTTTEQMMLMQEMNCPLLLAVGFVPLGREIREYFPPLLDAGCGLLMGYFFRSNGIFYGHSVVAESWDETGLTVLCSASPRWEGTVLEWDSTEDLSAVLADERTYGNQGNRSIVPWRTMPDPNLIEALSAPPLGIRRDFIIAWP
jgi:hypothetical protein